jgi:hypothetical protein
MTSLTKLLLDLAHIENNAKKHLDCNDLDIIIGVIKITKASAYLWSPKSDGGYGLSPGLDDVKHNKELPSWLKRAIQSDATASMTYMMGVGIGGAISSTLIPPTGAAFLAGWGISAGLGSAAGAAKL